MTSGKYLLFAASGKTKELAGSEIIEDAFLMKLVPGLSISSYQEISEFKHTQFN